MRGLISLAVIFFVALSAQASAKTFIRCFPERKMFFPSGENIIYNKQDPAGHWSPFTFSCYTVPRDRSKIKGISFPNCLVMNNLTDDIHIHFDCAPDARISKKSIEVDRISGEYIYQYDYSKRVDDVETVIEGGSCQKVKQKF